MLPSVQFSAYGFWLTQPKTALIPLQLKPLEAQLLAAALEIDFQCFGGLWTLDGYQRELNSPNSQLIGLTQPATIFPGAAKQSQPLKQRLLAEELLGFGCLWSILSEAHITILAVRPNYQRQGLGQALLQALLATAWQQKLEWATLEVRVSNQPALSLYHKFGFQEVGRRRRYYPDTGEDAVILWHSGIQNPTFEQTLTQWRQQVDAELVCRGWSLERYLPCFSSGSACPISNI
ncbi:Ribosomal-protein-S18p-alanine acetyltransferase [uncultured Synechococcales cyanobacterium]|uniref:Ribosomal-protein-S18p-alanine acetyltransferase n=1 Tax=uncultured Synechococcales cyanobacterium TaxID=1936017 RepID=A0A6J4VHF4_9CYAN|nr:Ribosomal-protein-S18p-alanine acetyltransferase [uncultured Synechococcales cyanobacterium]